MTLEEREKEMMEKFQALDGKQQEKMAMAERWRRAGLDWDSLTEEQQKGYENWDKIIMDMELYIANRVWDAAWMMAEEGYAKEDIEAFAAAHPELQENA